MKLIEILQYLNFTCFCAHSNVTATHFVGNESGKTKNYSYRFDRTEGLYDNVLIKP